MNKIKTDKFFTVEKQPIFLQDGLEIPNKRAIVRIDTKQPIGIVGTMYEVVDDNMLMEYFDTITKKLNMAYTVEKRYELRGGSKTITEIEFPDAVLSVAKTDELKLRIYLINSFDCTTTAKLTAGMFRLVCTNGMVIGTKDISVGYRHVKEVNVKIIDAFSNYLKTKMSDVKQHIIHMQQIKFKNDLEVLDLIDKQNFLGKRYMENILDALEKEKVAQQLTAWHLYNAYTYVITHIIRVDAYSRLQKMKQLNMLSLTWEGGK